MTDGELIQIYIDRFVNETDLWGKQWIDNKVTPPEAKYAAQSPSMNTHGGLFSYEPVTPELVARHIRGDITCAWAAIDRNRCSKWICFDSDHDDGQLERLDVALRSWGVNTIREGKRPGRAGHIWILFDRPAPASILMILGDGMMKSAGATGLERFPKSPAKYSQVRGPLGINRKPEAQGARGLFECAEKKPRSQLAWLAAQPLNRATDAVREARAFMPKPRNPSFRHVQPPGNGFSILEHVNARLCGKEYATQCPRCAAEGHDLHRDNLKISLDGSKFCCVFGGPNAVHKVPDIVNALLGR